MILQPGEKTFISGHILQQHCDTSPITLPVRRNSQHRSPLFQPLPHLVGHHLRLSNVLDRLTRPSCESLYATNPSHRKQETFLYEYPLPRVPFTTKNNAQQNASLR
jgi:hypothetical protein